jgi:hypothetical protein
MATPTENITADMSAACTARGVVISEIPRSSRVPAVSGSVAINCRAATRSRRCITLHDVGSRETPGVLPPSTAATPQT